MWVIWWLLPSTISLCSWFTDWNSQSQIHIHPITCPTSSGCFKVNSKSTCWDLSSCSPPPNPIRFWDSLPRMNHHSPSFTSQEPRSHPYYFSFPSHNRSITWLCLLTLVCLPPPQCHPSTVPLPWPPAWSSHIHSCPHQYVLHTAAGVTFLKKGTNLVLPSCLKPLISLPFILR